jgi:shikimate kinase
MNLALIGLRGSGKSAVARSLSVRLAWPWFDSDVEVELRAGKSIAAIFADDGEPAFRDLEAQIVAELAARDHAILALGGGAVLRPATQGVLRQRAQTVWLTASPETLWARIQSDRATASRRPNLSTAGGITEIVATLAAREPIYRATADWVVDTEHKTPAEVAEAIVAELNLTVAER